MSTGTYSFVSFIISVTIVGESLKNSGLSPCTALTSCFSMLVITQFADQVKIRFTFQSIKGVFSALQKLPKCFNGTAISTSFVSVLFSS